MKEQVNCEFGELVHLLDSMQGRPALIEVQVLSGARVPTPRQGPVSGISTRKQYGGLLTIVAPGLAS